MARSIKAHALAAIATAAAFTAAAPAVAAAQTPHSATVSVATVAAAATDLVAAETAPAEAAGPVAIDVNCAGTQDQIDTCLGATNYTPVSDYLGVPYYAQHNGMGGEAWLALETGDQVEADGTTYTITEIRTVATGGDIDQIAGMKADAYLQTCLDDNIHSNVYALATA